MDADKSGFITKGLMTNEMFEIVTNICNASRRDAEGDLSRVPGRQDGRGRGCHRETGRG